MEQDNYNVPDEEQPRENDEPVEEPKHGIAAPADESPASTEEGASLSLGNMFREYWVDYASDVILDRSVPDIADGLKPVQRRILHAMKETDDGRYTKVANIVGNTMQYHPHGDASIKDALVTMGWFS